MKKIIISVLSIVVLSSCGKKLPKKIASKLEMHNKYQDSANIYAKMILSYSDSQWSKIGEMEFNDLKYSYISFQDLATKYDREIETFLKYNGEYMDCEELKNKVYRYEIQQLLDYEDGSKKILDRIIYKPPFE